MAVSADWSEAVFLQFQSARLFFSSSPSIRASNTQAKWFAPHENQLRMDVDAVYNDESHHFAIGGAVRDHEGPLVLAFGHTIDPSMSVVHAELMAIREGLQIINEKGMHIHLLSTDSLLAVQKITSSEEDLSYIGVVAKSIRHLLDSYLNVKLFMSVERQM